MSKYIVTGGAGFIGSNLVRELVLRGHEVKVVDNLSTGKMANLRDVLHAIDFVFGDITDLPLLMEEFNGFDFVLHHAALASVPNSIDDPLANNRSNIDGTLKVLLAARDSGIKRVVYAASSAAYGDIEAEFKTEDMPVSFLSPYALAKYVGEVYCNLFYKLFGLESVSLRYFNVFGPNQDPSSAYAAVIPIFVTSMLNGEQPVIFGDGTQSRDFTFVRNVVEANILASTSETGVDKVFNIACGDSISLNTLIEIINAELGTNIKPIYKPSRPGDVLHSKADISKATKFLAYTPPIPFAQGIRETVQWYKSQLEPSDTEMVA